MSDAVTTWTEVRAALARAAPLVAGARGDQRSATARTKTRREIHAEQTDAARGKTGAIGTGDPLYSDPQVPRIDPDFRLAQRILREVRDAETGRDRPVAPVQRKVTVAPVTRARGRP